MTKYRRVTIGMKILGLIHDQPGIDGVELVKLYKPAASLIRYMEGTGLIVYRWNR